MEAEGRLNAHGNIGAFANLFPAAAIRSRSNTTGESMIAGMSPEEARKRPTSDTFLAGNAKEEAEVEVPPRPIMVSIICQWRLVLTCGTPPSQALALYDYTAEQNFDLTFNAGDIITVLDNTYAWQLPTHSVIAMDTEINGGKAT